MVGENGAGKSTLLKIIMGVQPASDGSMLLNEKPYKPQNPREANNAGIGMVFQEQSLITNLTVGQNIFLGDEKRFLKYGLIDYKKMYDEARKILDEVGLTDIKPEKYVRDLSFAKRQMIEIAKVISHAKSVENALILLDEPTSVLNDEEVKQLYSDIRKLAEKGHSIIFVSHRLDEVLEITERIYVFKDAANAGEFITKDVTEKDLYQAMVGKSTSGEYYNIDKQITPGDEVVLEVKNLSAFGSFKNISFELHKGEILGFCGVVGSGKEDLCYALCGDIKPTGGRIYIHGEEVSLRSPSDALKNSILLIPQERNEEGIFGILDITSNIAASNLSRLAKYGIVSVKKLVAQAKDWIHRLNIRTQSHKTNLNTLSGGNAQKVVFAKMLASNCEIVILNHPTRGVDVGAKTEIYQLIRKMAADGKSVILLGDTLDECIGLSNRVLVMKDGFITGEFDASVGNKPDNLDIIQCMM